MKLAITNLTFFLSTMSLASGLGSLVCQDNNGGPDHGYTIEVSKATGKANVSSETIAGPKPLAKLVCEFLDPQATYPDQMLTIAVCSEPLIADGGYGVVIQRGGIAGLTTATLNSENIAGPTAIAHFTCR